MVFILLMMVCLLVPGTRAHAQGAHRFELGPVARLDSVFIEGGAQRTTIASGVAARVRLTPKFGMDGEISHAWNRAERAYEGWFVSYAEGPNPTHEEVEQAAPILRRRLTYSPGIGAAFAFAVRHTQSSRVSVGTSVGVSARRYVETSAFEIVSIPEGVDRTRFARDFLRDFGPSSRRRTRGGLLFAADVMLAVTPNITIGPEVRLVYGGPPRIGYNHRELGAGVRAAWRIR